MKNLESTAGDDDGGLRRLFALWLPLAISFELMMLEGPAVQASIGRLGDAAGNLAAWGLTMSLSLLIESPVIMLLATAIALVRDAASFRALRTFTVRLAAVCTVLTALVAFTPLFDVVTVGILRQPAEIVDHARPAMRIMLLWTAAIAWRRFYQGVLVRYGQTRRVSWGTAIRLVSVTGVASALTLSGGLPGALVAAVAIMTGVLTEATATTLFATPILRRDVLSAAAADGKTDAPPLTQRAIARFHTPLALTTLLTLAAQPMTAAALARLDAPKMTLAAWPVVFMVLLVLRGWGLSLQEITVAQARAGQDGPALGRFTWIVGGTTSAITLLLATTPLLEGYLGPLLHVPANLHGIVRTGVALGALTPLLSALGSWARGRLVASGRTPYVYRAMGLSLATHAGLLALGVALRLPGIPVAAAAFTAALLVEFVYLRSAA